MNQLQIQTSKYASGGTFGSSNAEGLPSTLSPYDTLLSEARVISQQIKSGYCPVCGVLAFLYGPPLSVAFGQMAMGVTSMVLMAMEDGFRCTLCDVETNPAAQTAAVDSAYISHLIGEPKALKQSTINQRFWAASSERDEAIRKAMGENLEEELRNQPSGGMLWRPRQVLGCADLAMAAEACKKRIGDHAYGRLDIDSSYELLDTVGMSEVVRSIQAGESRPDWKGRERSFLTPLGLQRLHLEYLALINPGQIPGKCFPLGRTPPLA